MIDIAPFVANWFVTLPALVVAVTAMVVMAADLVIQGPDRDALAVLGMLGIAAAVAVAVWLWAAGGAPGGFQDTVRGDRYALFFAVLLSAGALLTLPMSIDYLREQPIAAGEYHALVLLSTSGMILLAAANDLIVLFLALPNPSGPRPGWRSRRLGRGHAGTRTALVRAGIRSAAPSCSCGGRRIARLASSGSNVTTRRNEHPPDRGVRPASARQGPRGDADRYGGRVP